MGMGRPPGGAARLEARLTAREAIRRAELLATGKPPAWLSAAVAEADLGVSAQSGEPAADPSVSENVG
jgi:hypothetical protein